MIGKIQLSELSLHHFEAEMPRHTLDSRIVMKMLFHSQKVNQGIIELRAVANQAAHFPEMSV